MSGSFDFLKVEPVRDNASLKNGQDHVIKNCRRSLSLHNPAWLGSTIRFLKDCA